MRAFALPLTVGGLTVTLTGRAGRKGASLDSRSWDEIEALADLLMMQADDIIRDVFATLAFLYGADLD